MMIISACEDPSNVGIGLIGEEQGGQPSLQSISPSDFQNDGIVRPGGSQPRVLTGRVMDPLAGTIEAEGYFDLSSAASSDFREAVVSSATLRLRPAYVYGDTTEQITFALRPVVDEFSTGTGLPADTTFSTGAVIREFTFTPTDTLVIVPMPAEWVESNDAVLRSEAFATEFHGFRLEHVSGNAVMGFAGDSQLRAFADADSAIFPVSRAYAAVRRVDDSNIPAERLFFQAGAGPMATFTLDTDSINVAAINQAKLVFQADTLALNQTPAGFVRPVVTTLDLYAAVEDDRYVLVDRTELDDEGRFIFDGTSVALELQRVLLGTREIERFEIRLPVGQGTFGETNIAAVQGSINALLFFDSGAPDKAPQAYLTVTPFD